MIEFDDAEWALVEDLFDPPKREGRPARYPRREMVEAILFLARTGCQWRYLPDRYPPWEAVWQQWRRWRASGVWARAMARIAALIRTKHGRTATPSMVMIDGQTVRGGRGGPTFHEQGGRGGHTNGAKRSIVIEILGLPLAVSVESARPHDVSAGRRLLDTTLPALGTVKAIVADRGYRGLGKMAAKRQLRRPGLRATPTLLSCIPIVNGATEDHPRRSRGPIPRGSRTALSRKDLLLIGWGRDGAKHESDRPWATPFRDGPTQPAAP